MASSKFTQAVEVYFTDPRLVRGSGSVTNERSLYAPLANLLDGLGGMLRPKVSCSRELTIRVPAIPTSVSMRIGRV